MKMIQRIKHAFPALLIIQLTSCEYYYTDELFNGFWQVTNIEHRSSGNMFNPDGEAYYAFQRHMIQLSHIDADKIAGDEPTCYLSYFTHEGDSLHTGIFRVYHEEDLIAPLTELKKFGIYNQETSFMIEETKNNRIILTSDSATITLRKY